MLYLASIRVKDVLSTIILTMFIDLSNNSAQFLSCWSEQLPKIHLLEHLMIPF